MKTEEIKLAELRPQAILEQRYIIEYLSNRGFSLRDLLQLSENEAKSLMIEACSYASLKLAAIEARAQFLRKIDYKV